MAKVLLVIGDAAEVLDTFYPLYRLREDGHEVVVTRTAKRLYHLVLHEKPDGWDITQCPATTSPPTSPSRHPPRRVSGADHLRRSCPGVPPL